MLVTRDQLDKILKQVNDAFARSDRMAEEARQLIYELEERVTKLEERKKPGRPPKDGA